MFRATRMEHILGYAVGIDMTRRDLQLAARVHGPAVGFRQVLCAVRASGRHPARDARGSHTCAGAIWLTVNGATRQHANLSEMIWSAAECVSYLSTFDPLEPGDLLFTGTPAGVGEVRPGDRLHGGIDGVGEISVLVVDRQGHASSNFRT